MNAWSNSVDGGKYVAYVEYDGTHAGWLIVKEGDGPSGVVIHREPTGIYYGAIFGPDMDDVARWSERTLEVIDNPELRRVES
jgi:hypothetical protein